MYLKSRPDDYVKQEYLTRVAPCRRSCVMSISLCRGLTCDGLVSSLKRATYLKPRPDYCVVSFSKTLYSTCPSQTQLYNEYQLLLGTNLRWISVQFKESYVFEIPA